MKTSEIIVPIVHNNGTSKGELLDLRETFYVALHTAGEALCKMAPNGRDYYPEPDRMHRAVQQHVRRIELLRDLQTEIELECEAINKQEH